MDTGVRSKIEEFFSQYTIRHYKKGHILLYTGDEVRQVYRLTQGMVKQYGISSRGDEAVLNIFKPPAFFPMAHVMNKTPAQYIFEAETDITVQLAPAEAAVVFLHENPDVTYDLLSRVYAGAEGLLGRMERLMTSSAGQRLVYELVLECRRFGKQDESGGTTIAISEKDLGSRAGLSRETVNREVHKLKEAGLIVVRRGSVHVSKTARIELERQLERG